MYVWKLSLHLSDTFQRTRLRNPRALYNAKSLEKKSTFIGVIDLNTLIFPKIILQFFYSKLCESQLNTIWQLQQALCTRKSLFLLTGWLIRDKLTKLEAPPSPNWPICALITKVTLNLWHWTFYQSVSTLVIELEYLRLDYKGTLNSSICKGEAIISGTWISPIKLSLL